MTTPATLPDPALRLIPAGANIAAKVVGDEAIIIDFASGCYYALDGAGVEVWRLIEAGASIGEVTDRLSSLYEAPAGALDADVRTVCAELLAAGVVRGGDASVPVPEASVSPGSGDGQRRYVRPTLSRYDDLAEVFAVDPPLMMGRDPR